MFDIVRNNKKFVQVFLALITLPFAFWGIDSYVRNAGGNEYVATVGDSKISVAEFQQTLRQQQERMRGMLGAQFNPAMLETPEMRRALVDTLINQHLLMEYAKAEHIALSNEQLASFITSIPALQEGGKFSRERYEAAVAAQGMTKEAFEARVRQELSLRQAAQAIGEAELMPKTSEAQWLATMLEQREVSQFDLKPEAYESQVKLAADAVKNYYDNNRKQFETPEQVRFEYVVLSQQAFAQQSAPTDAEIKAWYDSHQDSFKTPEERRASHILILAEKDAKPEAVKAAQEKAASILAQVKKNPADFAKLAKQYSQDPGSAKEGGDLGVVTRGAMVKPFEDAVFALKENQISDLVRTDYGFHIIRLTSLKPERVKPLAEVKGDIAAEIKAQTAAKKYADAAENFTNLVYEQADSLKPAAEKFGLTVQQGPWIAKGQPMQGLNPKIIAALFGDDAINAKHNTEAVEVAPKTLMSARVVEHKAAAVLPLTEVQAQIEKKLKRDEAVKLAAKDAETRLAKLSAGQTESIAWGASRSIARAGAQGMTPEALQAVFKAPADKLPAYAKATLPNGVTALYRVSKVKPYVAPAKDDERAASLRQQYRQMVAEADFNAWLLSLRERFKVEVNTKALQRKDAAEQG